MIEVKTILFIKHSYMSLPPLSCWLLSPKWISCFEHTIQCHCNMHIFSASIFGTTPNHIWLKYMYIVQVNTYILQSLVEPLEFHTWLTVHGIHIHHVFVPMYFATKRWSRVLQYLFLQKLSSRSCGLELRTLGAKFPFYGMLVWQIFIMRRSQILFKRLAYVKIKEHPQSYSFKLCKKRQIAINLQLLLWL